MSGIVKTIKNFKDNPLKAIAAIVVVAAAVWFTAGMATAYFSAPGVTMGQAAAASANAMTTTVTTGSWTSATSQLAAAGNTAGAATVANTAATVGLEASTVAEIGAPIAAEANVMAGATELGAATGAESVSAATAAGQSSIVGEAAMMEQSIAGALPAATDGTAVTAGSTVGTGSASKGIISSVGQWMGKNPIPTMILGQGMFGAYGAYEADKTAQREIDARRERGLMGFDYGGTWRGSQPTGIVNSQATQKQPAQVVAEPTVAAPQAPTVAVQRKKLPELQNNVA